jgi:8-oxo-dGTP pyrophosphatase MutT (NUDIX family)
MPDERLITRFARMASQLLAAQEEHVTVARAIVVIGNMLLVAQGADDGFTHLPGGHCEVGEEPADCLVRELREELGREVSSCQKLIELDNIYDRQGTTIHEHNVVFKATLYPARQEQAPQAAEPHLRLRWVPLQDLAQEHLMPPAMIDVVHQYAGA